MSLKRPGGGRGPISSRIIALSSAEKQSACAASMPQTCCEISFSPGGGGAVICTRAKHGKVEIPFAIRHGSWAGRGGGRGTDVNTHGHIRTETVREQLELVGRGGAHLVEAPEPVERRRALLVEHDQGLPRQLDHLGARAPPSARLWESEGGREAACRVALCYSL